MKSRVLEASKEISKVCHKGKNEHIRFIILVSNHWQGGEGSYKTGAEAITDTA